MKKVLFLLIIPLVISCCSFVRNNPEYYAYENKYLQNGALKSDNDNVNTEIDEIVDGLHENFYNLIPDDTSDFIEMIKTGAGIKEVLSFLLGDFLFGFKKYFFLLVFSTVVFLVVEFLLSDLGQSMDSARAAICAVLILPISSSVCDMISLVSESISYAGEFFTGLIPLITSVCSLYGGVNLSSAAGVGMGVGLAFVSVFLCENILSVALGIFSLSLISSFDTGHIIARVCKNVKSLFTTILGISTLLVVGILAMQTVFASISDSLIFRGAKYAVAGMVPIVGNVISGALGTLASGVKIMSKTIGMVSTVTFIFFMGAPLLKLIFYRLGLGACIVLASISGAEYWSGVLESLKNAIDSVIAVIASALLIYSFEILIVTKNIAEVFS